MNITQAFRRLGQKMGGWKDSFKGQDYQQPFIKKLYAKHGLEIKCTTSACPEQYEVFKNGQQVAYFRLRHGEFRVDYPSVYGETIYEAQPIGDGIFEDSERLVYLTKALRVVLQKMSSE